MPTFSGSIGKQIMPGLKFLGLIDATNAPTEASSDAPPSPSSDSSSVLLTLLRRLQLKKH